MKYSKQREAVMDVIKQSCDHPNAEMIYERVQKVIPNISLGTVYRNLNYLVEANQIIRISIPGECDHFDKTTSTHCHLFCTKCSGVKDVMSDKVTNLEQELEMDTGNIITSHNIVFTGICKDCKLEKKEGN